jgi:hypothetical protein
MEKRKRRRECNVVPRKNTLTYLKSNTWLLMVVLASFVTAVVFAVNGIGLKSGGSEPRTVVVPSSP